MTSSLLKVKHTAEWWGRLYTCPYIHIVYTFMTWWNGVNDLRKEIFQTSLQVSQNLIILRHTALKWNKIMCRWKRWNVLGAWWCYLLCGCDAIHCAKAHKPSWSIWHKCFFKNFFLYLIFEIETIKNSIYHYTIL